MTPRELANRRIGYQEKEKDAERARWELSRWELFNQGRFQGVKINKRDLENVYDIVIFPWEQNVVNDRKEERLRQEKLAAEIFPDRI